jgi:hypothetical protein
MGEATSAVGHGSPWEPMGSETSIMFCPDMSRCYGVLIAESHISVGAVPFTGPVQ